MNWPITYQDACDATARLRPYLPVTPLRNYPQLDAAVGNGIQVYVKHENHQPTNSFKVRNGFALMTALDESERRGVVAATRGNHGAALAWAGGILGIPVTVVVPRNNNPEKNEAMTALGARLIEAGEDYDAAVQVAAKIAAEERFYVAHSTNDRQVIAGAATMSLEILDQAPDLDALVIAVGGGSQAVGALTIARAIRPGLQVYAVQAAGAPAIHDAWHAGHPVEGRSASTFADGLATRNTYEMTFGALCEGLRDFVTVSDAEIADALRLLLRTTHNLAEGAGAAGLAGLFRLRDPLHGAKVGIVLSGSNIDEATLRRVVTYQL